MTDQTKDGTHANASTDGHGSKAPSQGGRDPRRGPNGSQRDRRRGDERNAQGAGGRRHEQREGTFPFELTTIRLHHGASVTAFDRSFDRYRTSFYHVTAVLQRLNLDDGLDLIQEYLEKAVGDALAGIREGKRVVLAALEARTGSQKYKVMVPRPEEREARVPSFTCRQYLEVFRELDDYLNAVVYAESVGAITWRDRRTLFVNAPRHAIAVAGRFQGVAMRLEEEPLAEERSLAIGQSSESGSTTEKAATEAAPATAAPPPEAVVAAAATPATEAAPATERGTDDVAETETRRRRKGANGQASPAPAAATGEAGAERSWA